MGHWDGVHIGHAGSRHGHTYFNLIDAYFRWVGIDKVQTLSAKETVKVLRRIFGNHGIPNTLVSEVVYPIFKTTLSTFLEQFNACLMDFQPMLL